MKLPIKVEETFYFKPAQKNIVNYRYINDKKQPTRTPSAYQVEI